MITKVWYSTRLYESEELAKIDSPECSCITIESIYDKRRNSHGTK